MTLPLYIIKFEATIFDITNIRNFNQLQGKNMKTSEQKEQFIELRAKDYSFDKISEELNISKQTLIKWNNELKRDITNLKFIEMEKIRELYRISTGKKIETLSAKLKEIYDTIAKYDISVLNIKEILLLKDNLETELQKETSKIECYSGDFENTFSDWTEEIKFGLD